MAKNNKDKENKGRGWHGDSAGHARAGRKGGRARSKKNKTKENNNR